jgi:hypothetical protein
MEEHCHFMACLPFRLRLACTLIVPMLFSSSHLLVPAMVAADCDSISGWVATLVTACLALGFSILRIVRQKTFFED